MLPLCYTVGIIEAQNLDRHPSFRCDGSNCCPPAFPEALLPESPPAGPTLLHPAVRVQPPHEPRCSSPCSSALRSVLPPCEVSVHTPGEMRPPAGGAEVLQGGTLPRTLAQKVLWHSSPPNLTLCIFQEEIV